MYVNLLQTTTFSSQSLCLPGPYLVPHAAEQRPVLARSGVVEPRRHSPVEHAVGELGKPEGALSLRVARKADTLRLGSSEEVVTLPAAGADALPEPPPWPDGRGTTRVGDAFSVAVKSISRMVRQQQENTKQNARRGSFRVGGVAVEFASAPKNKNTLVIAAKHDVSGSNHSVRCYITLPSCTRICALRRCVQAIYLLSSLYSDKLQPKSIRPKVGFSTLSPHWVTFVCATQFGLRNMQVNNTRCHMQL